MNFIRLILFALVIAVTSVSPIQAEPFSISTRTEEIPESGEVTRTVLHTTASEFTFIPPPGWKSQIDALSSTITWTSKDYGTMLRLKIFSDGSAKLPPLRADDLRLEIHREMSGATVSQEFTCYTAGSSGFAFDLEQTVNDKFPTSSRFAFIPCAGGRVRIQLTSPTAEFAARQNDFTRFLNSFRIETPAPAQTTAKSDERP
jgi:hypothetical protein